MLAVWVLLILTLPAIAQAGTSNGSDPEVAANFVPRATNPVGGTPVITPSVGGNSSQLSVSPGNLSFTANSGTNPASQSVSLSSNNGTINYSSGVSYSGTGGWLSLSGGGGSVTRGQPQTINFNVNSSTLAVGTYNATVTFVDTNFPSDTASVNVSLNVLAIPTISTQPANVSLVFNAAAGGSNPAALSVTLKFNGAGSSGISYSSSINYSSSQTNWLSLNPGSGSIAAGGTQSVTVNASTGNLAVGTYNATIVFSGPSNNVSVPVAFNVTVAAPTPTPVVATPTPVVTTTTTTTATTTTPVTTTTTTAATTTSNNGQGGNNAPTSSISGRVFINNAGAGGIVVRLNGGNYRTTDGNGYFTFGHLAPDTYHLTVLVDPKQYISTDGYSQATDIAGYSHPIISLGESENVTDEDFNLQSATATTPSSSGGGGPTATPTPIGNSDFSGCQPPSFLPNVLSLNYCVSKSPTDPNLFQINFVLHNATHDNLDLSHTLVFALQPGTNIQRNSSSQGQTNLSPDGKQLSWSGLSLAPGQSVSLNVYMTKAANSLTLLQSVNVTGVNLTLNSPFSAVLPAVLAQAGVGSDPITSSTNSATAPAGTSSSGSGSVNIPGGLPQTGVTAVANSDSTSLALVLLWLFAIVILGGLILLVWLKPRTNSRQ